MTDLHPPGTVLPHLPLVDAAEGRSARRNTRSGPYAAYVRDLAAKLLPVVSGGKYKRFVKNAVPARSRACMPLTATRNTHVVPCASSDPSREGFHALVAAGAFPSPPCAVTLPACAPPPPSLQPPRATIPTCDDASAFASAPLRPSGVLASVKWVAHGHRPVAVPTPAAAASATAALHGSAAATARPLPFVPRSAGGFVAESTLRRLRSDFEAHVTNCGLPVWPKLKTLLHPDRPVGAHPELAVEQLSVLLQQLRAALRTDRDAIRRLVAQVERESAAIPDTFPGVDVLTLRRLQGDAIVPDLQLLVFATLDAQPVPYLRSVAPYLSEPHARLLLDVVRRLMFRCNRVSQLGSCIATALHLLRAVQSLLHPADPSVTARSLAVGKVMNIGDALAASLAAARHYVDDDDSYDPRFLMFEYITGWLIRKSQVDMVLDFVRRANRNSSVVRQMIMGGGKSSVVSPLLVMCLADGKSLTMQARDGGAVSFLSRLCVCVCVCVFACACACCSHVSCPTQIARTGCSQPAVVAITPCIVGALCLHPAQARVHLFVWTHERWWRTSAEGAGQQV